MMIFFFLWNFFLWNVVCGWVFCFNVLIVIKRSENFFVIILFVKYLFLIVLGYIVLCVRKIDYIYCVLVNNNFRSFLFIIILMFKKF